MRYGVWWMLLFLLAWSGTPVHACTSTPQPTDLPPGVTPAPTPTYFQNKLDLTPVVLSGTIINTGTEDNYPYDYVVVEVDTYFKGTGPRYVYLHGINESSMCWPWVGETGHEAIFYIRSQSPNALMQALWPSDPATDTNLTAVRALVGEGTAPIDNSEERDIIGAGYPRIVLTRIAEQTLTPDIDEATSNQRGFPIDGVLLTLLCSVLFLVTAGWRLLR